MKSLSALLLVTLLLSGCASATKGMPPEEKEEYYANRTAVDRDNWTTCLRVYRAAGKPTVHYGHQHGGRHKNKPEQRARFDRRIDLIRNNCRLVVPSESWQTY